MQLFLNCCVQQDCFGVSHDAICFTQHRKVELDSTSATIAYNVARKVSPCVRAVKCPLFGDGLI